MGQSPRWCDEALFAFPERRLKTGLGSNHEKEKGWTFLSNHGHVLVCLADDPDMLLKDVAAHVGITERAVQQIVTDLEDAQVITRHREGRRNRYAVRREGRYGTRSNPVCGSATSSTSCAGVRAFG